MCNPFFDPKKIGDSEMRRIMMTIGCGLVLSGASFVSAQEKQVPPPPADVKPAQAPAQKPTQAPDQKAVQAPEQKGAVQAPEQKGAVQAPSQKPIQGPAQKMAPVQAPTQKLQPVQKGGAAPYQTAMQKPAQKPTQSPVQKGGHY